MRAWHLVLGTALAAAASVVAAADVPACSSAVEALVINGGSGACTHDLGRNDSTDSLYYLFKSPGAKYTDFCTQDNCRLLLASMTANIKSECTIYGSNVMGVITNAQKQCPTPATTKLPVSTTPSIPNCDSDVQDAVDSPYGSVCTSRTNATDGTIIYAKFCTDDDCKVFYQALMKAYTTECRVAGVNLKTYLSRIKSACPDIATTTAPPVSTTAPVVTSDSPSTTAPVVTSSPFSTPTPSTTSKPITTGGGGSNTAAIGAGIGGAVVIVILLVVIFVLRNRRKPDEHLSTIPAAPVKEDDAYAAFSDAGTDTRTTSVDFPEALALRPFQIPFTGIKFGQVISRGGYGEVLRGMYDNEVVAIKRLLPVRRDDPQGVKSFVKEIRLTASLKHECVVRFIGAAWADAKTLCMVSEFMHGGDLRNMLVKYSKTHHPNGHDDYKLRIAVQVAHAMTYLHSLDPPVVHRDLKSRNILLSASGNAKIIDFGVSCERQDLTMTAGVGTSLWMAPEVMSGDRYSEKADVFSFGVILSELDTHELPYDHARDASSGQKLTDYVLLEMIRHGRLSPRFTDKANPAIVQLARDCVQLDPASRPSSTEVLYRLDQYLQYEPTLTEQTRTALSRGISGLDTYATTRMNPAAGSTTYQMGFGTRATTNATSP